MQSTTIDVLNRTVRITEWRAFNSTATLVVVGSMYDYAEMYDFLGDKLFKNNITTITFDLVGHGKQYSDTLGHGYEHTVDDINEDIKATMQYAASFTKPIFVLGVGLGCNILLNNPNLIWAASGIIFASPLFLGKRFWWFNKFTKLHNKDSVKIAKMAKSLIFNRLDLKAGEGINSWQLSDLQLVGKFNLDRFFNIDYTYGWYRAMRKIIHNGKNNIKHLQQNVNIPKLVICGQKDPSIKPNLFKKSNVKVAYLPQSRHKIFNDIEKEDAVNAVGSFIYGHIK